LLQRVRNRLGDERGVTLIEMLIVILVMGFILDGIANIFVSGSRAQSNLQSQVNSQQDARVALDRLEYEVHCASAATVVGSGAGVALTMPSQCVNASGTITWCVVSGALERFAASGCAGTNQIFLRGVTSATPFSMATTTGDLPRLVVQLTTNETNSASNAYSINDTITLRNAPAS
jgi:prepilin-type N-terminal cleavage/methylation domain-containing protein